MKTIAVIVGTVPEAVKLGPVCRELLRSSSRVHTRVILSGQHQDRVEHILRSFGVRAWRSSAGAIKRTNLAAMVATLLKATRQLLKVLRPDLVLVQGDTATAFAGALAAFYDQIPVAHVEAGLTTGDAAHPFPEEFHREAIGKIATLLFAPSQRAAEHARAVARPGAWVFLTGNPCVDALRQSVNGTLTDRPASSQHSSRKRILVTVHRRENHGTRGVEIGRAIVRLAAERADAEVIYVGHNHPGLSLLTLVMRRSDRVTVLPPQGYRQWLEMLEGCYFVLSDSGGAQEEAPWLGKPVLVLRDETERPEVIEAGAAKLVGSSQRAIFDAAVQLLDDEEAYRRMQLPRSRYPYGRGRAARRIVQHVLQWLRAGPSQVRRELRPATEGEPAA